MELNKELRGQTDESEFTRRNQSYGSTIDTVANQSDDRKSKSRECKLESLGILALGIAHDFNNMLQLILAHSKLAIDSVPRVGRAHDSLEEIQTAGKRAAELVATILAFGRDEDAKFEWFDLVQLIRETDGLLQRTLLPAIDLDVRIETNSATVTGNPTQILEVILNLCANAIQAMDEKGGHLTLTLARVKVEDLPTDSMRQLSSGQYARIAVSDTGCGIGLDAMGKIFEPFFTTKEAGMGTGLGLSRARQIVNYHAGALTVQCKPGRETTFTVFLPVRERAQEVRGDQIAISPGADREFPKRHRSTAWLRKAE